MSEIITEVVSPALRAERIIRRNPKHTTYAFEITRAYLAKRADGVGVKRALEIASYEVLRRHADEPWNDEDYRHKGLGVRVQIKDDPDPTFDFIGSWHQQGGQEHSEGWQRHSLGEYLKNPDCSGQQSRDGRRYTWFELAYSVADRARDLIQLKYGKREAWEEAWRQVKQDFDLVKHGYQAWGVTVELFNPATGEIVGEDSLWGIDDEEYARIDVVQECILNAYQSALDSGSWVEPKSRLKSPKRKLAV